MTHPIILVGTLDFNGSKHLERYVSMHCESPYPHDVQLTIVGDENGDDNALDDALAPFLNGSPAMVSATFVEGDLHARIPDIAPAEALPAGIAVRSLVEAADYLVSLYRRLWLDGTVRGLAEAEASYNSAKADFILTTGKGATI